MKTAEKDVKTVPKEENKQKYGVRRAFFMLLPSVAGAAPRMFAINTAIGILHSISWGIIALVQQRFFDAATGLAAGSAPFAAALVAFGFLVAAHITCQILNGVGNYLPDVWFRVCTQRLLYLLHRKAARIRPLCYEDPARLDDINKAEEGCRNTVGFIFLILNIPVFYIPYFLVMGWYLFTLKPILAAVIAICFVPTALSQIIRTRAFALAEDKSAPLRRQAEHYEECVAGREFCKETRLLGGYTYFFRLFLDVWRRIGALRLRAHVKSDLFELGTRVLTLAGQGGILWLLFDALMQGEITVGAFAAVYGSVGMLYGIMEEVVCRHMGSVARQFGSVENYLRFLHMPEREGAEPSSLPAAPDAASGWGEPGEPSEPNGDIVLENVSFSYPGAQRPALSQINLTVKKGETLALVGENGSGKSTLIRLLLGIYDPVEGRVLVGSRDAAAMPLWELTGAASAVFQKYQRYQMTLRDNLILSDTRNPAQDAALAVCCAQAGLSETDAVFPAGYDTMLSREFDGVDLSGGVWQRLAIARAFHRGHIRIVLDEPTAAIDPLEETQVYNRFAAIARDKTAVIVTHRLGSVRLADRIVVLKDGRIAESGSHEELLAAEGEYARMYETQRHWYQ